MELDGLSLYHELEASEAEGQLCEEEGEEGDGGGSLQWQDSGVDVSQEVDGEGGLEESQQPETGKLRDLYKKASR